MDFTLQEFGKKFGVPVAMSEAKDGPMGGPTKMTKKERENFEKFLSKAGIDPKRTVLPVQRQTNQVYYVTGEHAGSVVRADDGGGVDGLITNEPNLHIITKAHDCPVILGIDTKNRAIFNGHSGWEGITLHKLPSALIMNSKKYFVSRLEDIFIWVGPTIDWDCYKFGYAAKETFKSYPECLKSNGRPFNYLVNLRGLIKKQLVGYMGIPEENITFSPRCTKCDPDLFSVRGGNGEGFNMVFSIALPG